MQIQKVQSNNTTFGYNAQVNAQLMNDLANAKKNKAFCKYLRDLCSITNQTELKLREADKKGMPDLTDKLARVFLPIKVIFTDIIDSLFPNYAYKTKELETYKEEMESKGLQTQEDHWLTSLVYHMQQDLEDEGGEKLSDNYGNNNSGQNFFETLVNHIIPSMGGVGTISIIRRAPSEIEEVEEDEEIGTENPESTENVDSAENAKKAARELSEKIKLGKSKVVEYTPEGYALQGLSGLGGMKELKAELTDKVVDFLKDPIQAKKDEEDYGTKLPKGLLLYGPPGCGKTTVLEHLSVEAGVPLLKLETGTLKGSYIHESSIYTDAAFEYAYSIAKPDKPVIMMIDDGDAFFAARDNDSKSWDLEEMTTFLNKIQEAPKKNVLIALTTNKYDIMDTAIKRRFDTQVYVGLPDKEARTSLLKLFFNRNKMSQKLANDKEAISKMAEKTESFPISAIQDMVHDACDIPRRESKKAKEEGKIVRREVTESDFETVLNRIENQNKKIKEDLYKSNATRPSIGFSKK